MIKQYLTYGHGVDDSSTAHAFGLAERVIVFITLWHGLLPVSIGFETSTGSGWRVALQRKKPS